MNKRGKAVLIGAEDEENLAIRYLAAVLDEAGHQVKVVPYSRSEDLSKAINEVKQFNPDLVGVSMAFQSLATMFFAIIRRIKEIKPEVHLTVGGHFSTFEYEKILEALPVDSVIRFEGEKPILMLMNALLNGENLRHIPNLVYHLPDGPLQKNHYEKEFPDLELIPFPLRNKKPHVRLGERFATLVTSRGCFHSRCLYCCIGAFHSPKKGLKYALRSPENVAREMGELYHQKKVRLFQFHDDNFLLPTPSQSLARIDSLKTALQEEKVELDNIAIIIKTRPDALSEDLASSLVDLGTVGVFLGVENASDSGLMALGRGSTLDDVHTSLEILKRYEVALTFNLLIFHPRATLDEINENIYFMNNNLDNAFDFGRAEIVAGSPLEKLVKRKGLLRGKWPQWDYRIEDPAVEKMFRINALTFYGENSPYPELSHQLIALSYRAQLLKRFYPGKKSQKLRMETRDLIRKSNEFTLKNLLQIYQITGNPGIEEEVNLLHKKMEGFYGGLIGEADRLSPRMLRFQVVERKFRDHGVENYFQNSNTMGKIFRI